MREQLFSCSSLILTVLKCFAIGTFALSGVFTVYHMSESPKLLLSQHTSTAEHQVSKQQHPGITEIIATNAGIYSPRNYTKDIIVLSANYGYLDFVINWVCTSSVLNLKYVVVSQDDTLHSYLTNNTHIPTVSGTAFNISAPLGHYDYDSSGFNFVSHMKFVAVRSILQQGYNVLFSDVDIVWLKNPTPFFRRDVDFEFQTDGGHDDLLPEDEPCTGFYYMKANMRSISLLEEILDFAAQSNYSKPEQTNMHSIILRMQELEKAIYVTRYSQVPVTEKFTFRQLPPLLFPNGKVFRSKEYEERRETAGVPTVIVHANWIVGTDSKRRMLHDYGLWRVIKSNESCEGNTNCYGMYENQWMRCAQDGETVHLR